jgi:hypothetical protein
MPSAIAIENATVALKNVPEVMRVILLSAQTKATSAAHSATKAPRDWVRSSAVPATRQVTTPTAKGPSSRDATSTRMRRSEMPARVGRAKWCTTRPRPQNSVMPA